MIEESVREISGGGENLIRLPKVNVIVASKEQGAGRLRRSVKVKVNASDRMG
jgi:hypothetical protein